MGLTSHKDRRTAYSQRVSIHKGTIWLVSYMLRIWSGFISSPWDRWHGGTSWTIQTRCYFPATVKFLWYLRYYSLSILRSTLAVLPINFVGERRRGVRFIEEIDHTDRQMTSFLLHKNKLTAYKSTCYKSIRGLRFPPLPSAPGPLLSTTKISEILSPDLRFIPNRKWNETAI